MITYIIWRKHGRYHNGGGCGDVDIISNSKKRRRQIMKEKKKYIVKKRIDLSCANWKPGSLD